MISLFKYIKLSRGTLKLYNDSLLIRIITIQQYPINMMNSVKIIDT